MFHFIDDEPVEEAEGAGAVTEDAEVTDDEAPSDGDT